MMSSAKFVGVGEDDPFGCSIGNADESSEFGEGQVGSSAPELDLVGNGLSCLGSIDPPRGSSPGRSAEPVTVDIPPEAGVGHLSRPGHPRGGSARWGASLRCPQERVRRPVVRFWPWGTLPAATSPAWSSARERPWCVRISITEREMRRG
jgi:hypothetical protein